MLSACLRIDYRFGAGDPGTGAGSAYSSGSRMTAGSSDRGLVEVVIWFGAAVLVLAFGCELRGKPSRARPEAKKDVRSADPGVHYLKRDWWRGLCGTRRTERIIIGKRRSSATSWPNTHSPHTSVTYRRIAVRYMFMAEDVLNEARARGDVGPQNDHRSSSLSDWGLISMCQQFCCGLSG
jgi:hypothetical protein